MNVTSSELEQIRQRASEMRHRANAIYRQDRPDAATQALPLLQDATQLEALLREHGITPLPAPVRVEKTEEQKQRDRMYDWTYHTRADHTQPALTAKEEKRRRKEMPSPQSLFSF